VESILEFNISNISNIANKSPANLTEENEASEEE
jgi:hypothetical protein